MRKTLITVATLSALAAAAGAKAAEAPAAPASPHTIGYNVGLASEYAYRGISQSDNKPAVSAGVDYSHASGVYLGAWASSISWLEDAGVYSKSKVELDVYGGFKKELMTDLLLDIGALRYQYPGTKFAGMLTANTTELYGAVNYKFASLKYSQSTTNLFGVADSKGSSYLELNANVDLVEGLQLNLHAGKQKVKNVTGNAFDYTDYKVGVSKDFGIVAASLAYIKTSGNATDAAKGTVYEDWYKGRAVLTVSKTF